MTPAERALLLAVAKHVREAAMLNLDRTIFGHGLDQFIAAVEAEAAQSCETCAKLDEECPGSGCTKNEYRYWVQENV